MDADEVYNFDGFEDYKNELDSCIYCGEELENLNIVHYAINPETCETYILAINPKPHEHFMEKLKSGFIHRIELVCDECLKEDFNI